MYLWNVALAQSCSCIYFVWLFFPGVRGADESELRRIVSEPYEEHLLMGADFTLLETILPKLSRRVCFTASEPPRPVKTSQPGKWHMKSKLFIKNSDLCKTLPSFWQLFAFILMTCILPQSMKSIIKQNKYFSLISICPEAFSLRWIYISNYTSKPTCTLWVLLLSYPPLSSPLLFLISLSVPSTTTSSWTACGGSQRPAGQWVGPQFPQTDMEPGHRWCHWISTPGHPSQLQRTSETPTAETGEKCIHAHDGSCVDIEFYCKSMDSIIRLEVIRWLISVTATNHFVTLTVITECRLKCYTSIMGTVERWQEIKGVRDEGWHATEVKPRMLWLCCMCFNYQGTPCKHCLLSRTWKIPLHFKRKFNVQMLLILFFLNSVMLVSCAMTQRWFVVAVLLFL